MSADAVRVVAVVSGHVQGVGYRYFVRQQAGAAGLTGSARNLPDGRVEVHVEGDDAAVDALVAWLHKGPPFARVESVEVSDVDPLGTSTFGLG